MEPPCTALPPCRPGTTAAAELEGHSGAYLQDCAVSAAAKQGQDAEMAGALWNKTEELLAAALERASIAK